MNLQEFAALKVGDQIDNPMSSSQGTVCSVEPSGVRIKWGAGLGEAPFFYSVNTTAWMHWSKKEAAPLAPADGA